MSPNSEALIIYYCCTAFQLKKFHTIVAGASGYGCSASLSSFVSRDLDACAS